MLYNIPMEQRFLPLLSVVFLAFLVPLILARYKKIPVVVGEIIAGILIGPSVLGWIHTDEPTLEFLAEIGFAFLMFLSGLEIDFSLLIAASKQGRSKQVHPLVLAAASFLLTVLFATGISFGLMRTGFVRDPWMMTLILSTTSLGIVVPVLKEKKMSSSGLGQAILLAALIADFLTMFLITIYIAVRSSGLGLNILLIGLLFIPVLFLYQIGQKQLRRPLVRRLLEELADATSQIKVRGSFALMVAFVVLAELIGAELILGAFLAGVLASLISEPNDEKIRYKLDAIGFGFFVPLFFIYVGVSFELQSFIANPDAWILLPILLLAAFMIKIVSSLVFRFSYSWRETLASGMILSSRLSLIIAASAIGLRFGAITESTNAAIILVAALTATFAPLGFNSLVSSSDIKKRRVKIIFGETELATQVGRELTAHGDDVEFIVNDKTAAARISELGFRALNSDGNLTSTFDTLSDSYIDAWIALSATDDENIDACHIACSRKVEHILSFVSDPIRVADFRAVGVQTLTPSLHRSSLLALMARNSAMFSLLTSTQDDRDMREFILFNKKLEGKRLMDLKLPQDALVLAIRRNEEVIVPHGTTKLVVGDHLTILGNIDSLPELEEILESW